MQRSRIVAQAGAFSIVIAFVLLVLLPNRTSFFLPHDVLGHSSSLDGHGSSQDFPVAPVGHAGASPLPDSRPVGLIIETKAGSLPNLVPLMLHFAMVLGPEWRVILFTLEEEWVMPTSYTFGRALADGRIEVQFLPRETSLSDSRSVSLFLTKPWLWEQVQSAERVLMFQSDSIICAKATRPVDAYLAYDFLGAPIDPAYGEGYNGGLSLRNPRLFLNITREADFENSAAEFEDQWFYTEARARQGANLPGVDVAKTFAVETIYHDTPLGYHQPSRWQADRMGEIEEWCPEVKMLIGRRAV